MPPMQIDDFNIKMEHQNHKHRKRRHQPDILSQLGLSTSVLSIPIVLVFCVIANFIVSPINAQQLNFLASGHNLDQLRIQESTPLNTIVHQLKAVDKFNENRRFTYHMTGDVFNVDERTGEVRLIKPLDRERQPNVTVVVSVFDDSEGASKSELPLETKRRTIIVEDIDDSPPVFMPNRHSTSGLLQGQQQVYQVELNEQAPVNTIVIGEIQATDADEGANAEILFECRPRQSTNSACDSFGVETRRLASGKYSATIKTRSLLDFERSQTYKLALVARGRRPSPLRGVPLETEAVININLINIQDEGPVFVNAPYSLSMEEGLRAGSKLLNLIVQDGDAAPQRELSVIVAPGPYSQYFKVERDPELGRVWYLETNETIDREHPLINEAGNMFNISLLAAELDESGSPVASELELANGLRDPTYAKGTLRKENVTIIVLDLPDTLPVFVRASTGKVLRENSLVLNISESLVTGSSVPNLDLAVVDMDQGINSRFRLSLSDMDTSPMASQAFALESEMIYGKSEVVLNILNSSLLDFEEPSYRTYKFNLIASKNTQPPMYQIFEVQFNIMDANDNSPEFDQDQYVFDVPEASLPGTVVATLRARDRDSGTFGKVDYMLRGFGASKFKLVSSEGKIIVNDCGLPQCLDYEMQPSFSLTYEAHDGGGRTKNVSVIINVIDINDHAPKFTESVYKRELISDNLSSKQSYISPQLIVRARDLDGPSQGRNNVSYRIRNSNLTSLDVDPISGLVYISQSLDLNSMISSMANSGQRSSLEQSNLSARLGAGKRITFEAEVVAEDNGSPMLNSTAKILLVVKGNRDGAPQFKQELYEVSVKENYPVNKPFFQVQAIDPDEKDSQLRYSLGYDLNDLISINTISGELSFKSKVDFDDFRGEPYNVTVVATDNNKPFPLKASALVSITISDVNNKAPRFSEREYKATLIQGQTKPGDVVMKLSAQDLDKNAVLDYSMVADQLSVGDRNGQQFSLEDLANSTSGYLAQMNRTERSQLVDDLRRLFQVNKKTGAVVLKSEPDYSFAATIMMMVRVADLNQELNGELQQDYVVCTFLLRAHVDRSPIFAPPWSIDRREYNITILEELAIGTPIFSLLAKDPMTNERIESFEKLTDSDPRDLFRVDRNGVVSVNKVIDYEDLTASKRLSVSVKATSSDIYSSIAELHVQVIDLNDNAPQFKSQNYSVSVNESLSYPSEILTVSAEDRDSSEFGQVYYSLSGHSSEMFTIHPRKGVISIRRGVKLDRDTEPANSFLVTASDCNETRHNEVQMSHESGKVDSSLPGCRKSSVLVTVNLIDENDNDPVFANVNSRGEFEALTSETVSLGSVITQARAIDADEGSNGQVSYEIVRGDNQVSKSLKIDHEGYISATESLSGLGRSIPYRINVRAYDHGKVSRDSYATLLLTISDVVSNDGVPKFVRPKPDETVSLSESAGPSTFVYQVQAVDPDEDKNGQLMYKFVQPSDTFEIDPFTGVIKTQYRPNFFLDREQVPNYTLIIVAQDLGSPPKQAHQVLSIKISDVNDNEPYFERNVDDPPVVLHVEEEIPHDSLIGTIQAIDKDVGQNALIGYEILEGNSNNLFRLSYESDTTNTTEQSGNNPCRIYSTGRLDRELKDSYTLTIKASSMSKLRNQFIHSLRDPLGGRNPFNQYNATDLTKIRVTIKLIDINDNRPVFPSENPKSVVDSGAEIYSQLMIFRAIDADSSNPEIQYSIVDALYHSDAKLRQMNEEAALNLQGKYQYSSAGQPVSMRHVFDIDQRSGILRNSVSLRPYIDGYFEVLVKADSGSFSQVAHNPEMDMDSAGYLAQSGARRGPDFVSEVKCYNTSDAGRQLISQPRTANTMPSLAEMDHCFTTVTKAIIFVTHQRETFRFVFDKTKLNDRLDEFKIKVQRALEEFMFEPTSSQPQASLDPKAGSELPRMERVYLNTFNTDFYEGEDGKPDFTTLTSCSQLVKFDDRSVNGETGNSMVPNQVINYDEVLKLLRNLNNTQVRNQKTSLFSQYGLVNIERCLPDRTMYRMSLSERLSLYFAALIALISILLAFIVSRMRKSYEKNLKLLQRSKYQYMGPYSTMASGLQQRPAHHMSLGNMPGNNFVASPYGSHIEYDGPAYDTWQL